VPDLVDLESGILRALCTELPVGNSPDTHHSPTRAAILAKLRAHHWQNPDHRVVFEALTILPGRNTTRMGFPDVNWDHYFVANNDNAALETLVTELLAASREEKP
jgi:hypothetical protein